MQPLCRYNIGLNLLSQKNRKIQNKAKKKNTFTTRTQIVQRQNMWRLSRCNKGQNLSSRKKGKEKTKKSKNFTTIKKLLSPPHPQNTDTNTQNFFHPSKAAICRPKPT